MKPVEKLVIAGVVVAALGGGALWYFNPTGERAFILACEDTLKDRLTAPSTYKRIRVSAPTRSQATLSEYLDEETPEKRQYSLALQARDLNVRELRASQSSSFKMGDYDRISYQIEYDAANGFGTPLRSTATCSQIVSKREPVSVTPFGPQVDGFDETSWIFFNLWKQKNPTN